MMRLWSGMAIGDPARESSRGCPSQCHHRKPTVTGTYSTALGPSIHWYFDSTNRLPADIWKATPAPPLTPTEVLSASPRTVLAGTMTVKQKSHHGSQMISGTRVGSVKTALLLCAPTLPKKETRALPIG